MRSVLVVVLVLVLEEKAEDDDENEASCSYVVVPLGGTKNSLYTAGQKATVKS